MLAYEVQHRADRLTSRLAQASTELLEKQRRALGWSKHQQCVDGRNINSLVEEVDGEQRLYATLSEVTQRSTSLIAGTVAPNRDALHASLLEAICHEASVPNADAEAQRSHVRRIAHLLSDLLDHAPSPRVVGGQNVGQLVDVITTAALPGHFSKVNAVVDTEVVERREVLLVDRVPDAKLRRDSSVEVPENIQAVGSLWCCSEPEKLDGLQTRE